MGGREVKRGVFADRGDFNARTGEEEMIGGGGRRKEEVERWENDKDGNGFWKREGGRY